MSAPVRALPAGFAEIPIRLLWAARDELGPGDWNHDTMANNFWRLYQNDADGATLTVGERSIMLERGVVYLVPAGLDLSSRNDAPVKQFFIHFDIEEIPPVVLRELFPYPLRIKAPSQFASLMSSIGENIAAMGYPNIAGRSVVKGVVYQAIGYALAAVPEDVYETCWTRMSSLKPVLPALQAIHDDLGAANGNAHLAALCHLSEDHFIKTFRDAIGLPPAHYMLKRRIASAAQRLLFTDDSIERIAEECGFADRFYFSRVFARETGRPPAAFRRGPRA